MSSSIFGYRDGNKVVSIDGTSETVIDDGDDENWLALGKKIIASASEYVDKNAVAQTVRDVMPHSESEVMDSIRGMAREHIEFPSTAEQVRRRAFVGDWRPFNWIFALLLLLLALYMLWTYKMYISRWIFVRRIRRHERRGSAKRKKPE